MYSYVKICLYGIFTVTVFLFLGLISTLMGSILILYLLTYFGLLNYLGMALEFSAVKCATVNGDCPIEKR